MARCDLCGNAPRWIYRVGKDEICGACCANRLAEARAENAKLRESLDAAKALLREVESMNWSDGLFTRVKALVEKYGEGGDDE